jgi:hypothetical protein
MILFHVTNRTTRKVSKLINSLYLVENLNTFSYLQRIIAGAFGAKTSNKMAPQWHPP